MIDQIKVIETENPMEEIWKNLRYFSHEPTVTAYLNEMNGSVGDKNILKQARQINLCIRQAFEYFNASNSVSISTKPLLLYYGAVSLCNALILLRKDGTHSIDYLRQHNRHRHHGLNLNSAIEQINKSKNLEGVLRNVSCKCHVKSDNINGSLKSVPWGNFALFYDSLVSNAFNFLGDIYDSRHESYVKTHFTISCADKLSIEQIYNKEFSLLELVQFIPDLRFDLMHLGMPTILYKGSVFYKESKIFSVDSNLERTDFEYNFIIDGITNPEHRNKFESFLSTHIIELENLHSNAEHLHFRFKKSVIGSEENPINYFPDVVEGINGSLYYILEPEEYIIEPAAYFMIMYQLGMLVRYYPDQWMELIDKNVQFSELMRSVATSFYRKFPNLILDQLTLVKHKFKTS